MRCDVIIHDPDRNLDFSLALECRYRGPCRPRAGWRDGGDPGEGAAVEVRRARCTEVAIRCGPLAISVPPGPDGDGRLESRLGAWCLREYPEEIERAVWDEIQQHRPRLAV